MPSIVSRSKGMTLKMEYHREKWYLITVLCKYRLEYANYALASE